MDRGSKSRILAAALGEFADRGFAGARTQRIAEAAGVNKQLLFYYFGSKQGLYEAVLAEAAGALAGADGPPPQAARGPDGVRKQLTTALARAFAQPEAGLVLVRGARSPDGLEAARMAASRLIRDVRAAILAGQGIGYFRDDADLDTTAVQAAVLMLGYLAFEPVLGSAGDAADRDAWLDGTVELVIRGLTW